MAYELDFLPVGDGRVAAHETFHSDREPERGRQRDARNRLEVADVAAPHRISMRQQDRRCASNARVGAREP